MKILFFKSILAALGLLSLLHAEIFDTEIAPFSKGKQCGKVLLLDQKVLDFKKVGGMKFSEISDLAYNAKKKILYLVGDEGKVFRFETTFSTKIEGLHAIDAVKLRKKNGKKFKKWDHDSEGLALDAKGARYISFEGNAKIGRFDSRGRMMQTYPLPKKLRDPKNYRSRNKSLEALAWHPQYGLLTATEWPLKHHNKKDQTIYSLRGKTWHFKAEPESKSGVAAMEVMDDGNMLVLERSYVSLLAPVVVTLKKVYLNQCKGKKKVCKSEVLVKMNNHKGWVIDNFEGLTRVGKNRYVMVSDDNDNFFQQTVLVYFEVKE